MARALEPVAEQDCESWGCDVFHHDCVPEHARDALQLWEEV